MTTTDDKRGGKDKLWLVPAVAVFLVFLAASLLLDDAPTALMGLLAAVASAFLAKAFMSGRAPEDGPTAPAPASHKRGEKAVARRRADQTAV